MNNLIKEIEDFELKHKMIAFIGIIILTIIITRTLTFIKDPDIIIRGYELHHFYYGITLLIIVTVLMLFGKKHYRIHLTLAAISVGLILDEFLYIMNSEKSKEIYFSSWPSALIFTIIISSIVLLIFYTSKNRWKKNK